jgi:nuclear GTP-binding protein
VRSLTWLQNPEWRSKSKKDPGIPNLFPYKDRILAEVEENRRLKVEETARRRELAKEQKLNGGVVTEGADDFEEFDAEDNEQLDTDSEDEDTMDVVRRAANSTIR